MDVVFFRIFDHFLHLGRIRLGIRCQAFNGQLCQVIGITQIPESFMSHNDIPVLRTFQAIPEFLVQLIKFTGIFLIICFVIIPVLGIRFYKSIFNILHLLLRPHRVQPDMRIFSVVTMSMIMASIQKLHTI